MSTETNRPMQHGRDDLTGEHKFGDMGQLIIVILFFIVWVLDSFVFKYYFPQRLYPSSGPDSPVRHFFAGRFFHGAGRHEGSL